LIEERARLARSLREREPQLWRSFARGKRSLAVASLAAADGDGVQAVHQLLAKAHVFVCDWETHELAPLGLDAATLRARYPQLVLANGTTFGTNAAASLPGVGRRGVLGRVRPRVGGGRRAARRRADAAAALWRARSGGAAVCGARQRRCFICAAPARAQRTDVNLLRSGLFGQSALGLVAIPRAPRRR
jgi:crotonobetainyl-CoA:carnitine CoA-transferase CaiB-like acyl-CoA transferase